MTSTEARGALTAAGAMAIVGSSFAVSGRLAEFPYALGQGGRYLVAGVVLVLLGGGRLVRLGRRDCALAAGVAVLGLVVFNLAVIEAVEHGSPSTVGVVVGCAPIALALCGPLSRRERPSPTVLAAAGVVVVGAGLSEGIGGGGATCVAWAALALVCEALFSLLAAPVVARVGPLQLSAWACLLAAAICAALVPFGPPPRLPGATELSALAWQAVMVTAVAFVGWYAAVRALGVARAGLLIGIMPASAYAGGLALGAERLALAPAAGCVVVGAGIAVGLRSTRS